MAPPDEPPPPRRYTEDEVGKILRRALERQLTAGQMDHRELVEVAREVGISQSELEAAAAEVLARREQSDDEREAHARVARRRRNARVGFAWHLAVFVLVNLFLFAIDTLTTGGIWFIFPLLGWGLGLALHAVAMLLRRDDFEGEVRRARAIREKREREAAAAARRAAPPGDAIGRGARALGQSVEQGVAALLEAAAHKIQTELDAATRAREAGGGTTRVRAAPEESARATARAESDEADEAASASKRGSTA